MIQPTPDLIVNNFFPVCNEEEAIETFHIKTLVNMPEINDIFVVTVSQASSLITYTRCVMKTLIERRLNPL